jgi:predicted DNA binding CopG/RHH family protein
MKKKSNRQIESFRMRVSETFKYKMRHIAAKKGMNISRYIRNLVEQDYQQELK